MKHEEKPFWRLLLEFTSLTVTLGVEFVILINFISAAFVDKDAEWAIVWALAAIYTQIKTVKC